MKTQDKLLDTAEILRNQHGYRGYMHLKIMPGAEYDQVYRAMQLADRISVNLEAPNTHRLQLLAPRKQFTEELVKPLEWIEQIRSTNNPYLGWNHKWPSSVTQFVVGAVGEIDLELLTTTQQLYRSMKLKRTYFSRFNPISDTPLENHPATSLKREQRLYQASFLLRDYGFDVEDLPFDREGNLIQTTDPKLAWARQNLVDAPVDLNIASRKELLRVPGIGPVIAERIISIRKQTRITELSVLNKLGAHPGRLAPYILLDGKKPPQQAEFAQLAHI
jgi:predicted DNA-binding helix-hairpin-helix protein